MSNERCGPAADRSRDTPAPYGSRRGSGRSSSDARGIRYTNQYTNQYTNGRRARCARDPMQTRPQLIGRGRRARTGSRSTAARTRKPAPIRQPGGAAPQRSAGSSAGPAAAVRTGSDAGGALIGAGAHGARDPIPGSTPGQLRGAPDPDRRQPSRILHRPTAEAHSKRTEAGRISAAEYTGRRARQPQRQHRHRRTVPRATEYQDRSRKTARHDIPISTTLFLYQFYFYCYAYKGTQTRAKFYQD